MSKRKEHTFQFTAGAIAKGAAAEAKYHEERATWWSNEYEQIATEAKEKGVEIRHFEVTGGKRAQLSIDARLSNRLEEAGRKRSEHQAQAERYKVEAAAYGSQPESLSYGLDGDDVMYWRLAGGTREDDKPIPLV